MPVPGKKVISFVGIIIPLVSFKKPSKLPFVRCKLPFDQSSGFTLIELVVTLSVVALLVSVAVPSMRGVLQNSRIITQNNNLVSDVHLARSEAIRRARTVSICTWNSTATPNAPTCDGGGNWSGGRVIWADQNRNGVLDAGEIVRSREGFAPITLKQQVNIDPIVFDSRGLSTSAVTFSLCDARGPSFGKDLRLTATGQIELYPTAPASCY